MVNQQREKLEKDTTLFELWYRFCNLYHSLFQFQLYQSVFFVQTLNHPTETPRLSIRGTNAHHLCSWWLLVAERESQKAGDTEQPPSTPLRAAPRADNQNRKPFHWMPGCKAIQVALNVPGVSRQCWEPRGQ